ncbi:DUF3090 family protein [Paenarthrobacter sp. DKR-5]|nr:DUF3090 family protein [Paenarthrobacter sp. DKR-5]
MTFEPSVCDRRPGWCGRARSRPRCRCTFYLQVRAGKQVVSVALAKQQAALLAEKIDEILDELLTVEGNPFSVPTTTPVELVDNDQLESVQELFRTGAMSLGRDPTTSRVVLEAHPYTEVDADDDDEPLDADAAGELEMLLVRMPVDTARAFAKRTREIVAAGRPLCPRARR